jgi:regulatory protein
MCQKLPRSGSFLLLLFAYLYRESALSAKSVAVRLLSRREHSAFEIRDKLSKRDFDNGEIEQAIIELQQGGWLSDERYAEAYIRMRQQKGFGPIRISIELSERGVKDSIIDSYLHAQDDSWLLTLQQQYLKKYKNKAVVDYNDKAKRIRFLQYRGFVLDAIYQVVK